MLGLIFSSILGIFTVTVAEITLLEVQKIRVLKIADRDMALVATTLVGHLANIVLLNLELEALYALCPAATVTEVGLAPLKAQGAAIEAMQNLIEKQIKFVGQRLQTSGNTLSKTELRRLPGAACGLPGILVPQKKEYLRTWNDLNSGFVIEFEKLQRPTWHFYHPQVLTL
jgi:hypothetical protein